MYKVYKRHQLHEYEYEGIRNCLSRHQYNDIKYIGLQFLFLNVIIKSIIYAKTMLSQY